jgi:hypothetical protein
MKLWENQIRDEDFNTKSDRKIRAIYKGA